MGILKNAVASFESTPVNLTKEDLGWVKIAEGSSYGDFKNGRDGYENSYPSVTKIINKFMEIRPYTVDGTGEKVDSTVKNVLYHPNRLNSSVEFREALALMYLIHAKTHILVWRKEGRLIVPGGDITKDNIAGFTIMENPVVVNVDGENRYTITTAKGTAYYTDKEVITLRGLNPYAINTGGYSPTVAARKWMNIDDYIADYQQGFFRNGAVPTGQFIITAATKQDYNDIVDKLQERHRGAGKNGNVTYTHRPVDPNTKKPLDAQIEWIPFATPNRELSLKDLFQQANMKIDSVYGVPASVRGVGENNNYATARTDQQNFMLNVVKPITLKIWTGFTHELNRITGGLGVAIDFHIEVPALADEELVNEQRGKIRDERFIALFDKGYTIDSIDEYFATGDIKKLSTVPVAEEEDEDEGDIDDDQEVNNAPNPDQAGKPVFKPNNTAGKDPDGIYSPKGRFLGKKLANGLIMLKSPDKEETIVKV